jgi:hypothetical protein
MQIFEVNTSMHTIWNKNDIRTYQIECGNFTFWIHTHLTNINEHAFDNIIANDALPHYDIVIWIDMDNKKKYIDKFNMFSDEGIDFFPDSIRNLYDSLDNNSLLHGEPNNHVNRYSLLNNIVYARFPYDSDDFYLSYQQGQNEIFIIGDEITLERVIVDFLSMTVKILPLHAGCVKIGRRTLVILGKSQSGKTSLVLKLMSLGAEYISDDILFIIGNKVFRHGSYIAVRRDFLLDQLQTLNNHMKSDNIVYLNISDLKKAKYKFEEQSEIADILMLHPMDYSSLPGYQLFPAVPHDSAWCIDLLGSDYRDLNAFVGKSKEYYYDLLKNTHNLKIDFSDFDKYAKDLFFQLTI